MFAFTFQGVRYTYTRLPQGFVLSPGIFNSVLRDLLKTFCDTEGIFLVQYVDDILLAALTEASCLSATRSLLLHLHSVGLKCSQKKVQCCCAQVTFLGRVISAKGTGISSLHRSIILHHPKPLSTCSASWDWQTTPDFTYLTTLTSHDPFPSW